MHQEDKLYKVQFDAKETANSSTCESGYIALADIGWLENESAALQDLNYKRIVHDIKIPFVSFEYVIETPSPTEIPSEAEAPTPEESKRFTVTCLDSNGFLLTQFSIGVGETLTANIFQNLHTLCDGGNLKGWYPCDEYGVLLSDHPMTTDTSVTQSMWMMAVMEDLPTPEPSPTPVHIANVMMHMDTDTPQLGTTVTLHANLEGYGDANYVYHWQFAQIDAQGNYISEWQDTDFNTTELTYSLSAENLFFAWRFCIAQVNE